MRNMNRLFKALPFFLLLASCSSNSVNNKLIIGNWVGAAWTVDGQEKNIDAQTARFSFDDKGNYTLQLLENKEEGTYKVENDMLFTTPAKQQEIMVKITKLTKDSLVFDMNRSGQAESLTLLRK